MGTIDVSVPHLWSMPHIFVRVPRHALEAVKALLNVVCGQMVCFVQDTKHVCTNGHIVIEIDVVEEQRVPEGGSA